LIKLIRPLSDEVDESTDATYSIQST